MTSYEHKVKNIYLWCPAYHGEWTFNQTTLPEWWEMTSNAFNITTSWLTYKNGGAVYKSIWARDINNALITCTFKYKNTYSGWSATRYDITQYPTNINDSDNRYVLEAVRLQWNSSYRDINISWPDHVGYKSSQKLPSDVSWVVCTSTSTFNTKTWEWSLNVVRDDTSADVCNASWTNATLESYNYPTTWDYYIQLTSVTSNTAVIYWCTIDIEQL